MNPFAILGRIVLDLFAETGRIALFAKDGLLQGLSPRYYLSQFALQFWRNWSRVGRHSVKMAT